MSEVPEGWHLLTLGDVARWGSGGTPTAGRSDYYDDGDIPWAVIGDLPDGPVTSTQSRITRRGLAESSAKLVPPGAILVAMYGSIGKLGLTEFELATNQAIAFAIAHDFIVDRYLFWYLMSQRGGLTEAGKGATQKNIGQGVLKSWPIPIPPLDEQRRIVDILEDHLSRLDAANDSLNLALARLNRMTTSALWRTTHEIAEAHQVRLTDVADVRLGRQRSPANHSGNRMRPYLRAANVDWDRLRLDDVKSMNFTEAEEQIYRLEPGDVLLTEASGSPAEVGKSVLYRGVPEAVCFQNTLLRIRCHDADPAFVQKYLLAEARAGRFMPESRGVGINHLGRTRLANLEMRLPRDQNTQQRAADACETVLSSASAIEHAIRNQRVRSSTLRRALLAAAFSGRLTGRSSECDLMEEAVS